MQFKNGWGGREYVINYWKYDFRQRKVVQESSKEHGFHNKIFRRMPMPVLRLVGNLIYRLIGSLKLPNPRKRPDSSIKSPTKAP